MSAKTFQFNHAHMMERAVEQALRILEQQSGYTVTRTTDSIHTDIIEIKKNGQWGGTIFMRQDGAGGGALKLEYGDELVASMVEGKSLVMGGKSPSENQTNARVM